MTSNDLPVCGSLSELVDLVTRGDQGGEDVFVRWSRGPAFDLAPGHTSTDELTGVPMPGLSASPLKIEWWWQSRSPRVWIARRSYDYSHLRREKGPDVRPWVLTAREVARGPDNEPLVAGVGPLAWVEEHIIAEACEEMARQRGDWGPMRRPDDTARPLPGVSSHRRRAAETPERSGSLRGGLGTRARQTVRPREVVMNASATLSGKKVAILAASGVEQVELVEPRKAVEDADATTMLLSVDAGVKDGRVQAMNSDINPADTFPVDALVGEVSVDDFDALVLPGGAVNPDKLRLDDAAVAFVREFVESGKPVGAICHAPWTLVEADVVRGRRVTGYPSVRTDLRNAGATVVDEEVVTDQGLVTSRGPDDLSAFCSKIVEEFAEGRHERR